MKRNIITVIMLLFLVTLNFDAVSASFSPTFYSSRYEFYDEVIEVKEKLKRSDVTNAENDLDIARIKRDKLDEIVSYYDFRNTISEVELYNIIVMGNSVSLHYNRANGQSNAIMIVWRKNHNIEEYMGYARGARNYIEINYNGNTIIKQILDDVNQYWWVENGEAFQVNVSPWLLELYPEETFFNIQMLNVSLLDLPPRVKLNGTTLDFDTPPVIEDGRILVPLRTIFEALGSDVYWYGDTQTVTSVKGDTTISMQIGSNELIRNSETISLDVPAQLVNERTLVPARVIAEAFGATVDWDEEMQTVIIQTEESPTTQIEESQAVQMSTWSQFWGGVLKFIGLA